MYLVLFILAGWRVCSFQDLNGVETDPKSVSSSLILFVFGVFDVFCVGSTLRKLYRLTNS